VNIQGPANVTGTLKIVDNGGDAVVWAVAAMVTVFVDLASILTPAAEAEPILMAEFEPMLITSAKVLPMTMVLLGEVALIRMLAALLSVAAPPDVKAMSTVFVEPILIAPVPRVPKLMASLKLLPT